MPGTISRNRADRLPQRSLPRRVASAAVLAGVAIVVAATANAQGMRQEAMQQASIRPDPADRQNNAQTPGTGANAPAAAAANVPAAAPDEVGILFLRADGGDPQELRADSGAALVFVARRNGDGRAYRNGREVGLDPLVKDSAAQIAIAQFGMASHGDVAVSELPATAQLALRQYANGGAAPHVAFAHVTSRADTGLVSDERAKKILSLESSANAGRNMVALVRMAMQMFGLKSDACDNSDDARCNEPGVREAFAQIKSEEAQQRATTAVRF